MTYINHRQARAHETLERVIAAMHRGCAAQAAVDKAIETAGEREAGQQGINPREGGGKRLPARSARPRMKGA